MVRDENRRPLYSTAQFVDIGARKAAEEALLRSEARYRGIIETTQDGIWQTDAAGTTTYVNQRMADMLGYSVDKMLGLPLLDLLPAEARETVGAHQVRRAAAGKEHENVRTCFDLQFEHLDGRQWWGMVSVTSMFDEQATYLGSWAMVSDITARKQAENELRRQALHDTLTGLPNRTLFMDRLEQALAGQARRAGAVAILFLDLDRFKVINDSLGHAAGDQLLVSVATRLKNCIRAEDTVARMGGDEFAVLVQGVARADHAVRVAKKLLAVLERPCRVSGHDVVAGASIGIVTSTPAHSGADLLREADIALYRAKAAGRGRCELFDATMAARALERLHLEAELRQGLERGEFEVYYQPKIDLASGKLAGMEALVRWRHPSRGLVAPDAFIPLAEETGLICPLGQWVLEEACRQTRRWNERGLDPRCEVSVNLSARQFAQPALVDDVARALRETGVNPGDIQLEITESTAMGDAPATVETLRRLKALGVQLALDDFGTGYSSLAYLRRFPIDVLKIDRAFVASLLSSSEDASIIDAVVSLGHALKLSVVGEGVETESEARELVALGCDLGQGYFFARPLPREGADQFIEQSRLFIA
jgi:diguanylate cyclase (GGDEF)-like protein/PAS domain S-box-containing protein